MKTPLDVREKNNSYRKERFADLGIHLDFYKRVIVPAIHYLKGYKCEECGATKHLDVHHTDYANVNINTLKLLCRKCHRRIHP